MANPLVKFVPAFGLTSMDTAYITWVILIGGGSFLAVFIKIKGVRLD